MPGLEIHDHQNGIRELRLNSPEIHNAFDDVLIHSLNTALKETEQENDIRVVLLTASGKSFSSGGNLHWMEKMVDYSEKENLNDALSLAELMRRLNFFKKPTIALVQGPAFGGGVGLIACCDIALATPNASFCFSEVKLGLIPSVISPYVIAAIGERVARRYFITAEKFDAKDAQRIGLITGIVDDTELMNTGLKLANNILQNGPDAVCAAKRLILDVAHQEISKELIHDTAQRIAKIRVSLQGQEGIKSFIEKRKPHWCL